MSIVAESLSKAVLVARSLLVMVAESALIDISPPSPVAGGLTLLEMLLLSTVSCPIAPIVILPAFPLAKKVSVVI